MEMLNTCTETTAIDIYATCTYSLDYIQDTASALLVHIQDIFSVHSVYIRYMYKSAHV